MPDRQVDVQRKGSRDLQFSLHATERLSGGRTWSLEAMQVAVLMDIRDELQKLNALLHCGNFTGIPATLRGISRKIPVRKKRR